jgi:hypothetical protein
VYSRKFISDDTCFISTEFIGFKTDLLAWLYRWFEILTNTKYENGIFLFKIFKKMFLDMIKSSHLSTKATISSVLGSDYTEPANEEEKQLGNGGIVQDVERMYEELDDVQEESMEDDSSSESDDELIKEYSQATFSPFCEKVTRKKELPTPLFAGRDF